MNTTDPDIPFDSRPPWKRGGPNSESSEAGDLFEIPPTRATRTTKIPARPQPNPSPRRSPVAGRPDFTAIYRLYDARAVLLYVGMSNAPLERYVEHRDTKEWWPDVAEHSIEWRDTREEAGQAEIAAIKDEWPLHNIAHQPRGDGTLVLPSYIVERLVDGLRASVEAATDELTSGQVDQIEGFFRHCFDPDLSASGEVSFADSATPPRRESVDLDGVIEALGPFRPPIVTSMRVATTSSGTVDLEGEDGPVRHRRAEQRILGAMLLSKEAIADAADSVKGRDFFWPAHELVFDSILDLHGRGEPTDVVTVADQLNKHGELVRIGGAEYLRVLVDAAAGTGVRHYAAVVSVYARTRETAAPEAREPDPPALLVQGD